MLGDDPERFPVHGEMVELFCFWLVNLTNILQTDVHLLMTAEDELLGLEATVQTLQPLQGGCFYSQRLQRPPHLHASRLARPVSVSPGDFGSPAIMGGQGVSNYDRVLW